MRNEPAPQKYLNQGNSPLHSLVLWLFHSLADKHRNCGMDNLYNSAKFCRATYQHPNKVLAHGVTQKGGQRIPKCVQEQEVKPRYEHIRVWSTVKAALLIGDDGVTCLVPSSVYDV